jgi:hypothetical protein
LGPPLRSAIFDETNDVIWEAKGEVGRFAVRLAIGQLLDYARFEPDGVRMGVLLPRRPADDLVEFIASVGALVAWPKKDEQDFTVLDDGMAADYPADA